MKTTLCFTYDETGSLRDCILYRIGLHVNVNFLVLVDKQEHRTRWEYKTRAETAAAAIQTMPNIGEDLEPKSPPVLDKLDCRTHTHPHIRK